MSNKRIQCGDIVDVYFEHSEPLGNVEVIGKPQDAGDCWKLYSNDYDKVYNVQNFRLMVLVERKKLGLRKLSNEDPIGGY